MNTQQLVLSHVRLNNKNNRLCTTFTNLSQHIRIAVGLSLTATGLLYQSSASAQVTPDGTLSTSVSTSDNLNFIIDAGNQSGRHLFHSFDEFSVPANGSAQFSNTQDIQTIFSRVTGGRVSEIHGDLGTNHSATLFLMNPSGIIFGADASLNIGGSLFATTAESIVFEDGGTFNALQPNNNIPLLTVNVAPGLQIGQRSGPIRIEGSGHSIIGGGLFPFLDIGTSSGLQVRSNESIGFIASEIDLQGGILKTTEGNIYLGSMTNGLLQLRQTQNTWDSDHSDVDQFGDIYLAEQSLVTSSGPLTGHIHLQGRNIELNEGSLITIQNFGQQMGGNIQVEATDALRILGSYRIAPDQDTVFGRIPGVAASDITNESFGSSPSGNILINSSDLLVNTGGSMQSRSYGSGKAGDIILDVSGSIFLDGTSLLDSSISSKISSFTFSSGNAGDVNITAQNLTILDGAIITSATLDEGRGGTIEVNAENLVIDGFEPIGSALSSLSSASLSTGDSGALRVNVRRLSVLNGGVLSTSTLGEGNAGTLTVNASESIYISDDTPNPLIISGVLSDAPIVEESFQERLGVPESPSGNSGSVLLNTPQLMIVDGGLVAVSNRGSGNSGRLRINADEVILNRTGAITASSKSGQGGDITLNVDSFLALAHGSLITAENGITFSDTNNLLEPDNGITRFNEITTQNNGNGGNITIHSPLVIGLHNSDISANAVTGNGGNISIATQGLLGLVFRDRLTPRSDITASSEFGLDGMVEINRFNTALESGLVELPAELTDAREQVVQGCKLKSNRFTITGRGGIPTDPDSDRPWSLSLPDFGTLELDSSSDFEAVSQAVGENTLAHHLPARAFKEATQMTIAVDGSTQLTASHSPSDISLPATCAIAHPHAE